MDWSGFSLRIHWARSRRRLWPATRELALAREERRKHCNVLLYWWAGRGERSIPSGTVPIVPGVCHWARPGWTYTSSQSPTDPLGVTAVHFDLLDSSGSLIAPSIAALPPEELRVTQPDIVRGTMERMGEAVMRVQAGTPLEAGEACGLTTMFQGLLMLLDHDTGGVGAAPAEARHRREFSSMAAFIHDNVAELPSVAQLAARWGYSRSHFCRLFARQLGMSPQEYIIHARTSLARELLDGTDLAVTQIAAQAGYPDLFRFSKQFKRTIGVSPSRYRARATDHTSLPSAPIRGPSGRPRSRSVRMPP